MRTEIIDASDPNALRHAADVLHHSGLVAFPTDTVYGLAALPFDEGAVTRLYVVKGRNSTKAIAVLLSHPSELDQVAGDLSPMARRLAQAFWPGPLTLVVPKSSRLPNAVSPSPNVGVRIPDHPVALDLLRLTGPLAVTSANQSGKENTYTAREVLAQLKGRVHLILNGGPTPGAEPSTVIDCTQSELVFLRQGPISPEDVQAALRSDEKSR